MGPGEPDINRRQGREHIGLDESHQTFQGIQEMPNRTETTVMDPVKTAPYLAMMKMMHTMHRIMIWPASMFANKRTVRETGFMKALKTSMMGMMGFRNPGTSGQKMSL